MSSPKILFNMFVTTFEDLGRFKFVRMKSTFYDFRMHFKGAPFLFAKLMNFLNSCFQLNSTK